MRHLAAIAFAMLPAAVPSQDMASAVARGWQSYLEMCGSALTDPQGFLDAHPTVSADGTIQVDSSPDGAVVVALRQEQDLFRMVEFLGIPGRIAVYCEVNHTVLDLSQAMLQADGSATAEALRAYVASQPGSWIKGGAVMDGMRAMPDGHGYDFANNIFAITAPMGGRDAFIYASAHAGGFHLNGLYFIEGGN